MGPPTQDEIRQALAAVIDPCSVGQGRPMSVIDMGLLREVEVDEGVVTVRLYLTSPMCTMLGKFQEMAEDALLGLDGVEQVRVEGDNGTRWPGLPTRPAAARIGD